MQTIQDLRRTSYPTTSSSALMYRVRNELYAPGFCSTLRNTSRIIRTALSSVIGNHQCIFRSRQCGSAFALPRVLDLRAAIYQFERLRHILYVTKYLVCRLLWRARAESYFQKDGDFKRKTYSVTAPGGMGYIGSITAILY